MTRRTGRFSAGWDRAWVLPLIVAVCCVPACSPTKNLSGESTDLYIAEMWSDVGLVRMGAPINLTERPGYDNQPSYSLDGRSVLYVSREGMKADVYRYDLDAEQMSRLTSTGDREYSPKARLGGDGFSAIRAERGQRRRLWDYSADGGSAEPVWKTIETVMLYYAWADSTTAAIVMEGDSGERALYRVAVDGETVELLSENVGRSVNRIPGRHAVSFVQKATPADWWISEFDFDTGEFRRIARTIQGAEDHAWTPSGGIVMGGGSNVFLHVPGADESWSSIADFSRDGIRNISRIAVSPNGDSLIVVADDAEN